MSNDYLTSFRPKYIAALNHCVGKYYNFNLPNNIMLHGTMDMAVDVEIIFEESLNQVVPNVLYQILKNDTLLHKHFYNMTTAFNEYFLVKCYGIKRSDVTTLMDANKSIRECIRKMVSNDTIVFPKVVWIHIACRRIQRQFRKSMSDPSYKMCQNRLIKEFENIHLL
jgi:hypothetical protein